MTQQECLAALSKGKIVRVMCDGLYRMLDRRLEFRLEWGVWETAAAWPDIDALPNAEIMWKCDCGAFVPEGKECSVCHPPAPPSALSFAMWARVPVNTGGCSPVLYQDHAGNHRSPEFLSFAEVNGALWVLDGWQHEGQNGLRPSVLMWVRPNGGLYLTAWAPGMTESIATHAAMRRNNPRHQEG